ncbi:Efg1 domain-containing protein [Aspergillus chevalieri]|uniref:rRNA-processing protein EFG1 n=1 Tax=Aspergillus chevalieri TaxID=182096 RepID=A0A7R7ZL80_ASPCH|nr:18S rRNA maturation protein [Aspergillus chevalieri]BCR85324.1 18S rRNA maturation protein [Aspergillus chevalieri]
MPKDRYHSRDLSPAHRERGVNKRKHREASEDAPVKKKIQLATQKREKNEYPSVNELKRRIRAVKRLLEKVDLSADARIVQERALSGYEKDLEDEMQRRERSQMIKKYHFVRFLDRKSATKDLKRLQRREKETTDQKALESLREKIHATRVNLNYTIYYPLTDKYISLYAEQKQKKPSQSESGADDTHSGADEKDTVVTMALADTGKPPMWYTVEKCMEEGTLDLLREGKLNSPRESGGNTKKTSTTTEQKKKDVVKKASKQSKKPTEKTSSGTESKPETQPVNRRIRRNAAREDAAMRKAQKDDGDDSDGGFFEI